MTSLPDAPPATATFTEVLGQLQSAVGETSLDAFSAALCTFDTGDPETGFIRVAAEIDRIERSFRRSTEDIREILVNEVRPAGVTEEDMNFLSEIVDIIPSITDSLSECSDACKRGDLSLEEVSSRVSTAAMIVARGTERFRPPSP